MTGSSYCASGLPSRARKTAPICSFRCMPIPHRTMRAACRSIPYRAASDKEAEALAAQKSKSDLLAGVDLSDEQGGMWPIALLISLAQRQEPITARRCSPIFCMPANRVPTCSSAHRFAGFAVLKSPDTPSVLIELGFSRFTAPMPNRLNQSYRDKTTSGILAHRRLFPCQEEAEAGRDEQADVLCLGTRVDLSYS